MPRRRLDELFDAAQDIPASRRDAWLDDACGGDAGLRAELERLLAADARDGGVLESGDALIAEVMAEAAEVPECFGAWRVQSRLGAGGMGEVWLAERSDGGFVQRAAIKQVAWPTPGLLQRFQRERQILAQLEHPGIARLIDGGTDDSGCPYLAMEYVQGQRIDAWVRERVLGVRATVRLLLQVCEAVQFAHRNLVVHSDIKPSNILVTADGSPRLLDFGVARVLSGGDAEATHTATRLMTPDYAAPEWLAGGAVTTAVDVYALGVLAYELLAGARPYRLDRGGDVVRQLADRPAQPPSAAVARDAPDRRARLRALQGDLDRIVQTAMAHAPARRYASVEALAQDLRSWLDGRPVAARGDNAWYRLRKFVARNRVAVGAVALILLTLVLATAFSIHQARRASLQATRAQRQAMRAEAVRDFLVGVFEQANPDRSRGKPIAAQSLLDAGRRQLERNAAATTGNRVEMTGLIGHLYWLLGDYEHGAPMLREAAAASHGAAPSVRARNLLYLARSEAESQRLDDARAHAEEAAALLRTATGDGSVEGVASAIRRLVATIDIAGGDSRRAVPMLRKALVQDRKRFGEGSEAVADDYALLASGLKELTDFRAAIAMAERAVAAQTRVRGAPSSGVITALETLASSQGHAGDLAASEQSLREAVRMATELYGDDHRETLVARSNLYLTLSWEGKYAEALAGHLDLLKRTQPLESSHPDQLAFLWNLLALDYAGLGKFTDAERAEGRSLQYWKRVTGPDVDYASNDSRRNMAWILALDGRLRDAERMYRDVLRVAAAHEPPSSQWLNRQRAELADVLRQQRRYPESIGMLRTALQALRQGGTKPNSVAVLVQTGLAQALLDSGDMETASVTVDAALRDAASLFSADKLPTRPVNYAAARIRLASGQGNAAERMLRPVLRVRAAKFADHDPRVLEVQVALIRALAMQGKTAQADKLRTAVQPVLAASSSPYLATLRERLATR